MIRERKRKVKEEEQIKKMCLWLGGIVGRWLFKNQTSFTLVDWNLKMLMKFLFKPFYSIPLLYSCDHFKLLPIVFLRLLKTVCVD